MANKRAWRDLVWLAMLVAGVAWGYAPGDATLDPGPIPRAVCFSVRNETVGCFGPLDRTEVTVDGRTDPPSVVAEYFPLVSGNSHFSLSRGLVRRDYRRLLEQAEANGLWGKPTARLYSLCLIRHGRPVGPYPIGQRDEDTLSKDFFEDPVIAAMSEQLKRFYGAHQSHIYPRGTRVGEIVVD